MWLLALLLIYPGWWLFTQVWWSVIFTVATILATLLPYYLQKCRWNRWTLLLYAMQILDRPATSQEIVLQVFGDSDYSIDISGSQGFSDLCALWDRGVLDRLFTGPGDILSDTFQLRKMEGQ
jgi:hypothetical protein